MKKLKLKKLKKLKGKKKSFPKSTKPVGLRSGRCCWQKFGVRIQSIGLDAGKASLLFGTIQRL